MKNSQLKGFLSVNLTFFTKNCYKCVIILRFHEKGISLVSDIT